MCLGPPVCTHKYDKHCAGDVVIARSPQNVKNLIVKRVIGLEGDTVHVQGRTWLGPPQTLVVGLICSFSACSTNPNTWQQ